MHGGLLNQTRRMNDKETLENIIPQLITRGEDARELRFWQRIYRDLSPELQEKLSKNLETELNILAGNI